jgi:hypothetical protein
MPTKAQRAKLDDPRIVWLSWAPDDFGTFAKERFKHKLANQADNLARLIKVYDEPLLRPGDIESVVPWGDRPSPTDVVVLCSDEYATSRVTAETDEGEFNQVLKLKQEAQTDTYQVWFAVVQNTSWDTIYVNNRMLRDLDYLLHHLRPNGKRFSNELKSTTKLDDEVAEATRLLKSHPPCACYRCKPEVDASESSKPPDSSSVAPPSGVRALVKRVFGRGAPRRHAI